MIFRFSGVFLRLGLPAEMSLLWDTQTISNNLMARWTVCKVCFSLTDILMIISSTIEWRRDLTAAFGSYTWTSFPLLTCCWVGSQTWSDSVCDRVVLSSPYLAMSKGISDSWGKWRCGFCSGLTIAKILSSCFLSSFNIFKYYSYGVKWPSSQPATISCSLFSFLVSWLITISLIWWAEYFLR